MPPKCKTRPLAGKPHENESRKRKKQPENVPSATKIPKKNDSKSSAITFKPLHRVQIDVAARVCATVERSGAAYLVARPGSGKSTLLLDVTKTSTESVRVLNMIAVSSAALAQEMRRKVPLTVPPPFNSSKLGQLCKASAQASLRAASTEAKTVTICVTYDFLSKNFEQLYESVSPDLIRLIVDEAHNICKSARWSQRMGAFRRALAVGKHTAALELVLVSATPNLDVPRTRSTAASILGVGPGSLEDVIVQYTFDEEATIRADLCVLPPPNEPTVIALREPSQESTRHFEALGTLVLGDFIRKLERPNAPRLINSTRAMKNFLSEVLAVSVHHEFPPSDAGPIIATGGQILSNLESKVKTRIIGKDGEVDGKKLSPESALVLHCAPRGLNKHKALLRSLKSGEDGVVKFTAHNLSTAEKNIALFNHDFAEWTSAVDTGKSGHTLGLVLPKNVEGTDVYGSNVTRLLVIGSNIIGAKKMSQATGRFDRPPRDLVAGKRVRRAATEIVHFTSKWAEEVLDLERLSNLSVRFVTDRVRGMLNELGEEWKDDSAKGDRVCKMLMRLAGPEDRPLLPGITGDLCLIENFCSLLNDAKERDTFMKVRYTKTVQAWACNEVCDEDEEDEGENDEGEEEGGESDDDEEEEEEEDPKDE